MKSVSENARGDRRSGSVESAARPRGDVEEELGASGGDTLTEGVERPPREPVGVGIGRVPVRVVLAGGLGGSSVSATVMRHHTAAVLEEEHQLHAPVVRTRGPAVVEHDGLVRTPVLVEDLGSVVGSDGRHRVLLGSFPGGTPAVPQPSPTPARTTSVK